MIIYTLTKKSLNGCGKSPPNGCLWKVHREWMWLHLFNVPFLCSCLMGICHIPSTIFYKSVSCHVHYCTGHLVKSMVTDWYYLEQVSVVNAYWVEDRTAHSLRACSFHCEHVVQCNSIIWKNSAGMPDDCVLVQSGIGIQIALESSWIYWKGKYHIKPPQPPAP